MSLAKVGNRSLPSGTHRPESEDELGIPGPHGSALFYQDARPLPMASHARGIYIYDEDGRDFLDGCSGAISANLGHGDERVIAAATEQLAKVAFTYRTQFENRPANELADLLVRLSPPELNRVFFVNSGSEAVESAVKLARQYWWSLGKTGKSAIIARRPSYHGATLGALSCTSYAPLNIPYQPYDLGFIKISAPFCYRCPLRKEYPSCGVDCADELERAILVHGAENIAAFITEPIGGASTGAAVPPDEWFPRVERICHDNDILLIVDDVLAGCGRTGTFFGFEHWDVTPDIVAVSKGLSGGYAPIGACIASDRIVAPVMEKGGFMHGHTYAGNPLSSAIAREVIRVMIDDGLVENARDVGVYMHERLHDLKNRFDVIGDVRGRGLLAGIELVRDRESREPFPANWVVAQELTVLARENHRLLIYPRRSINGLSGDHVLIAPPLIIDREGVDELMRRLELAFADLAVLLDRHLAPRHIDATRDGTVARYEPSSNVPLRALGHIEGIAHEPAANVTAAMDEDLPPQSVPANELEDPRR